MATSSDHAIIITFLLGGKPQQAYGDRECWKMVKKNLSQEKTYFSKFESRGKNLENFWKWNHKGNS